MEFFVTILLLEMIPILAIGLFLTWAIKKRKRFLAIVAGVLLLIVLAPFAVTLDVVISMPIARRNTQAMLDKMKNQHIVGQSASDLINQYGQPNWTEGSAPVTTWFYSPCPWYMIQFDFVFVNIEQGKVVLIGTDYSIAQPPAS